MSRPASSANTRKAYASDWRHFTGWCRRQGLSHVPPDPLTVGLCITACASGTGRPQAQFSHDDRATAFGADLELCAARHAARSERPPYRQRCSPAFATPTPPLPGQKEAILPEDLIAMLETLDRGNLRGLRDRAMLLIGFAGGLCAARKSSASTLAVTRRRMVAAGSKSSTKACWSTLRGKTRLARGRSRPRFRRRHLPGRRRRKPGSSSQSWRKGPLFRRVTGKGKDVGPDRSATIKEVARLVKKSTALAAGVGGDLSEGRARGQILRPFSARRPCLLGRGRRALCAKAARPCQRRNDPQISAAARPLPGQSHQGIRALTGPSPAPREGVRSKIEAEISAYGFN